MMQIGVVFPQTEVGAAVADVRRYATAVEELGFTHLLAYDHVLGADPEAHAPWRGPYDVTTTFHEPFVLFGYLAACTRLELVTGVIILPQRQTALVAKQAAEVDLLTEGRFRLGVGLGWNAVEYEALGAVLRRPRTPDVEQIPLLRRLLSEPVVDPRRQLRPHHGRRPRPAARPTADPDLDRRRVAAGLSAHRSPRRRLVPRGAAGPGARRGPGDHRRGGDRRRAGPDHDGHGRPGALVGPPASPRSSTRSVGGATPARPTSPSTR